jgi:hypothetical protein
MRRRRNPSLDNHLDNFRYNVERGLMYADFAYREYTESQTAAVKPPRDDPDRSQRLSGLACESARNGLSHLHWANLEQEHAMDSDEWERVVEPLLGTVHAARTFMEGVLWALDCPPPGDPWEFQEIKKPGAVANLYVELQKEIPDKLRAKQAADEREVEELLGELDLEALASGEGLDEDIDLQWAPGSGPKRNPSRGGLLTGLASAALAAVGVGGVVMGRRVTKESK